MAGEQSPAFSFSSLPSTLGPPFDEAQGRRPSTRLRTGVTDLVFFYGTLMAGFDRRRRAGIDAKLTYMGRGSIQGALFDLGIYPAAVPAHDRRVWGEVYRMSEPETVLAALDDIEGYRPDAPDLSLYSRNEAAVLLPDGTSAQAWVYFYNAPLGRAPRIDSGDYLEHVKIR